MPKGKIANPGWIKVKCQYCDKEFDYYRETSSIRKACYDCIPDGQGHDASLIRRLLKKKIVDSKGNKCCICNKSYPYGVYDLHHLDPNEKDFNFGDKTSTVKVETVMKEAEKCILVCANCHRMIHSGDIQIAVGNDGSISVLTGEEQ